MYTLCLQVLCWEGKETTFFSSPQSYSEPYQVTSSNNFRRGLETLTKSKWQDVLVGFINYQTLFLNEIIKSSKLKVILTTSIRQLQTLKQKGGGVIHTWLSLGGPCLIYGDLGCLNATRKDTHLLGSQCSTSDFHLLATHSSDQTGLVGGICFWFYSFLYMFMYFSVPKPKKKCFSLLSKTAFTFIKFGLEDSLCLFDSFLNL